MDRATRPSEVIDAMLDERQRGGRLARRGLLRVRGRQARRPVEGPARGVPAGRATRRRSPCSDLEERMLFVEAHRDGQVPRRGRHRDGRRREHRLDPRHRVPGLDRRRPAVHQRLRRRPRRASSRARASSPRSTASASSRRPRWSRRPSAARRTPTSPRSSAPPSAPLVLDRSGETPGRSRLAHRARQAPRSSRSHLAVSAISRRRRWTSGRAEVGVSGGVIASSGVCVDNWVSGVGLK